MKVLIEDKRILIDGDELEYYPYYFSVWKEGTDHRLTVKSVLDQWAVALTSLGRREAVYLPYYLDDEICKYLHAVLEGENVVLTDRNVKDDGWAIDLDDLSDRMYSQPEVFESYSYNGQKYDVGPKFFGQYNVQELIESLKNAEIVTHKQ